MNRSLLSVCGLIVVLAACQVPQQETGGGAVYSDLVARALQQRVDQDTRKRMTVEFQSGATAQNCREYLRLLASSTLKENVNNQGAKGEYLVCEAFSIIGDRKLGPGRQDVAFGRMLAERLDLRSFPSSLFQMLDDQKYLLAHFGAKALNVSPASVTYETGDWHFRLELVATLDVNNNGKMDWILWMADESKSGNYRQYQTLVVQDVGEAGTIGSVPFAVTMGAQRR